LSATRVHQEIRTDTLPCGIRLATERMPNVRSATVGFWVGTGSRDEPDALSGASHFLEHLLFKGTPDRSARSIAEALDEVGGDSNAYTTKEYTTFYVRLLAEDLALGIEILSDIMREPALRGEDVSAERQVILDEILMHADEPADLAVERWTGALFPGHGLGRDTLGTSRSVGRLDAEHIRAFFAEHYRPANIVVAAAGDCDHEMLADAIEARFAGVAPGGPPLRSAPPDRGEPLVIVRRPTEQAHLVLGTRSASRFDEERWSLAVLNHVLGGGLSSRLFQKIREERGLAYSVWSDRMTFEDAGCLSVGVGTAPAYVDEVLRIVTGELEQLAEHGITERELAVAKGNLRAETLLSAEDSGSRMSHLGSSLLLHEEVWTLDRVLARIDAVDLADVHRSAERLAGQPRTLAGVGPFDEADFDGAALGLSGRAA